MKKVLSLVLSFILIISCFLISSATYAGDLKNKTINGIVYYYKVKNNAAAIIDSAYADINEIPEGNTLKIPSKLGKYPVKALEEHSVIAVSREVVAIPNSVESIKEHSVGNSKTKTVQIGSGLKTIQHDPFGECRNLEKISVNSKNKNFVVYKNALYNKGKTTLYKYPAIKIPKDVTILSSVKTIGEGALADSRNLKTVNIGKNVKTIKPYAFNASEKISKFVLDKKNKNLTVKDGVVFNKKKTVLIIYPCAKSKEKYTVPKGVSKIAEGAFEYSSKLKEIKFPTTLTEISNRAFRNAYKLKIAKLPSKLRKIGNSAFEGSALTEVVAPKTLEVLGSSAFEACGKLKKVDLSKSKLTKINASAFSAGKINELKLPKALKEIGNNAFAGNAIVSLDLPESVATIDHSFSGCSKLKTVIVRGMNTDISEGMPRKEYITYAEDDEDEDYPIKAYKYSFKIQAKKGSKAEQFAIDNDIEFVELI